MPGCQPVTRGNKGRGRFRRTNLFAKTPEHVFRMIKVASSSTETATIPISSPHQTKTRISRPQEMLVHLGRCDLFPLTIFVEINPIALLRYKGVGLPRACSEPISLVSCRLVASGHLDTMPSFIVDVMGTFTTWATSTVTVRGMNIITYNPLECAKHR